MENRNISKSKVEEGGWFNLEMSIETAHHIKNLKYSNLTNKLGNQQTTLVEWRSFERAITRGNLFTGSTTYGGQVRDGKGRVR